MTRLSRRSLLRSSATLALATSFAGCTDGIDDVAMASGGIPGVEDGEIADHHAFASAHGDQLASRTGTVERTTAWLDRETGDPERHAVRTVRVDGDHVHAVVSGELQFGKNETDRLEVYFDGGSTIFLRTRTDGEWTTTAGEPREVALDKGGFTGTTTLETVSMSEVGVETVDGEQLHRFANAERDADDGNVEWLDVQALVDDDALVHSFQQTLARTDRNVHESHEWYLTNLDATTVDRPDWVAEADD